MPKTEDDAPDQDAGIFRRKILNRVGFSDVLDKGPKKNVVLI
jgi:hypothetical protein